MEQMLKEFRMWRTENRAFYEKLAEHDALLTERFRPVYEVLDYLTTEIDHQRLEAIDDYLSFYQVGLAFLNDQRQTCKLYLENVFQDDFHAFLKYERIINALLFIEDLKYECIENKVKIDRKKLDALCDELEIIIEKKQDIPTHIYIYIDGVIQEATKDKISSFKGIIDIFVEIGETLGLAHEHESEFILGKDI